MDSVPMAIAIALAALPFAILAGWFARREMRRHAYRRITVLGGLVATARQHPEKHAPVWVEKADDFRLRGKLEFDEGNNYLTGFLQLRNAENALKQAVGEMGSTSPLNRAGRRAARKRGARTVTAAHVVGVDGSVRVVRPQPRQTQGIAYRKRGPV